jgi:hypothetical protein
VYFDFIVCLFLIGYFWRKCCKKNSITWVTTKQHCINKGVNNHVALTNLYMCQWQIQRGFHWIHSPCSLSVHTSFCTLPAGLITVYHTEALHWACPAIIGGGAQLHNHAGVWLNQADSADTPYVCVVRQNVDKAGLFCQESERYSVFYENYM